MSNPAVLITGALTGIGRATALAFARQGARLVVSGRKEEAGRAADVKAGVVAGVLMKRPGEPEEIAQAILFVSSDKASFITGQVIDVNGGMSAS